MGPARALLDHALRDAGIDREELFVTNVVKHFKWVLRGKRRIHQTPRPAEIEACIPWLEAEVHVVKPEVIVALGATAAKALLGSSLRVSRQRGDFFEDTEWAPAALTATVHPSSLLRMPDREARRTAYAGFTADLERIKERIGA